jgi:PAS domain S-box-containing protein
MALQPSRPRGLLRAAIVAILLAPAAARAHDSDAALSLGEAEAILALGGLAVAMVMGGAVAIRERRRSDAAERERARMRRHLDLVSRHANDMVFVTDAGAHIVDANDRAVATLGYTREELLALDVRALRDPETLGDFEEILRRQIEREALVFETRYRRKDGSVFPVEVSVRVSELGGQKVFVGIARDLTERKASEEALRASEAKFRAAFEGAGIGIVLIGPDGLIREANPAFRAIAGEPEEALRGRDLRELSAGAGARRALDAVLGGARDSVEEPCHCRRRDGAQVDVVFRARAVRDGAGKLALVVALVQDVSEAKRLESQLFLADRLASVGTLAAGVAHEINNPLAFVLANLDVALEALRARGAPEDVLRALEDAREGGGRVREIVRDLKTFSRDVGGAPQRLDVCRILRSSVHLAMPEMRRRARVELDLGDVPAVLGAEHRLGQVFLNLLINAAQAIPEGVPERHRIRVAARGDAAGRAVIEISDTGVGIPPELLGRIFDPFFTTKPVGIGTGLGLAIGHAIVTELGGEIHVRSEPGKGTAFEVVLPAAPGGPGSQAPRVAAPAQVRLGRILVIDDEPLVGRAVVRVLSPPHEVVADGSARAALDRIEGGDRGFDVLLCDLMMPGMSGMELHERLRQIAPDLARRVVFLTGGASSDTVQRFLEETPQRFVEKPFDPGALRRLVTSLLAEVAA